MLSPALAFRPARVVERLSPRSAACPLSSKDLVRVAAALRLTLPLVRAPTPGVARAALVAAKQVMSVLGLSMPDGAAPEPWFAGVTAAADEVAAGLPIFLAGEVKVAGRRESEVETAYAAAWRLADAGLTHLTIDLTAVSPEARSEVLERVSAPAVELGLGLDCLVAPGGGPEARPMFQDLMRRDAAPDMASLRCEAPEDAQGAHEQVKDLLTLCATLSGTPVLRRGPVTAMLLSSLKGSPVAGCEDGGAALEAVVALIPLEPLTSGPSAGRGPGDLALAEAALPEGTRSRVETLAYLEVLDFLERLGTAGSGLKTTRALERTLSEPAA
jgi:hypothetical protein